MKKGFSISWETTLREHVSIGSKFTLNTIFGKRIFVVTEVNDKTAKLKEKNGKLGTFLKKEGNEWIYNYIVIDESKALVGKIV